MRKKSFKLIRETTEWRHRIKGAGDAKIKASILPNSYRFFKIYGNEADNLGVGDYDSSGAHYTLPIHIHAKSLMGGEEFVEIHNSLKVSKIDLKIIDGFYSTTPNPERNGTVIIGPSHVKFKKKTPYTLAMHMKYFTSATKRRIGMRFDYSDGTYDEPVVNTSSRELKMCFTSDASKDLVSISSSIPSAVNIRISIEGFGLYEGAYTDYETTHESYCGQRLLLHLDAPLKKIDRSADEIDIIGGILTQKIHTALIDASAEIEATDEGDVFEISLSKPMRRAGMVISPFATLEEEGESGLTPTPDGEKILFKAASDITSVADIKNYLSENPFYISYVLKDYEYKTCELVSITSFEREVTVEPLCSVAPSKIIAEYV